MSMQLGASRLIDDAFALLGRANTRLTEGNATSARILVGKSSRMIAQAERAAHPALGHGHGAQSIKQSARLQAEAARTLIKAGNVQHSSGHIASARFALNLLRPG